MERAIQNNCVCLHREHLKETSGSRNKKNTVFRSCHFQMHWYLIQLCARAYFNISRMNTNKNIIYNMPLILQEAKSTVVAIFKCPGMTKKNVRVQSKSAMFVTVLSGSLHITGCGVLGVLEYNYMHLFRENVCDLYCHIRICYAIHGSL